MLSKTGRSNVYKDDPGTAVRYDSSRPIWEDGRARAAAFDFAPQDSVLDIGSGPGVLSVPLAGRVRSVCAVEPSETMVSLMEAHCRELGIDNLSVINSHWEDVDLSELPVFDHVIASYSLFMEDLQLALRQMNDHAKKSVHLFWFCGTTSWERILIDLYPAVYGKEYVCPPKSDLIYGMLAELGISASVKDLDGTAFSYSFPDLKAAAANVRQRLGAPEGFDELFESYAAEHYRKEADGSYTYVDRTHYVQISWKPVRLPEER